MIRTSTLYLIFLIVLNGNSISNAQQSEKLRFRFRKYTVENGLTQNSVTCLLQDRNGFIWVGTMDGLNRFDGYEFSHFKHQPGDSASLAAPYINCLFEDKTGRIWIGTDRGGVSILNPYDGSFRTYKVQTKKSTGLSNNRVTGICSDAQGFYWIATLGGGLNRLNEKTGEIVHFRTSENKGTISNDNIINMILSSDGCLYLATRQGLSVFNPLTLQTQRIYIDSTQTGTDNRLQYVYEDALGSIYVASFKRGLFTYKRGDTRMVPYTLIQPGKNYQLYNAIFQDNQRRLWFAGNSNGLVVYDSLLHFVNSRRGDNGSLNVNSLQCFLNDRMGNVWIGSLGGGLHMWSRENTYFSYFDNSMFDSLPPGAGNIFSITTDKNKCVWFGTNGEGLYCYDPIKNQTKRLQHNPSDSSTISSNSIWSLLNTTSGYIAAGTFGEGLNLINTESYKAIRIRKKNIPDKTIPPEIILHLADPGHDTLLLGTMRTGLEFLNVHTGERVTYSKSGEGKPALGSDYIYSSLVTRDGHLFLGTQRGGLCELKIYDKSCKCYEVTEGDSFSINNNDVQSIFEDSKGSLWLGTNGGGLNVFDRATGHFLNYTEKEGLPNNVVYSITSDREGHLWMSTNNGICRFTPPSSINFKSVSDPANKNIRIRIFSTSDGLSSNEFNQGAFHKDEDGKIYFGSVSGITSFYPEKIKVSTYHPKVYLTSFKVFEKEFPLDTSIIFKKSIELNYEQNFFSFTFATLNYFLPEKCTYAVWMEGFDKDWVNTGSRRYISYTNLDPGTYFFKVKATNNDGIWSDHIASIKITINPPFWKTWWFRTGIQLLLISLVFLFFRIRINRVKNEEKKKAEFRIALSEIEMKALRTQMNPHFIFNSLNSINNFVMENNAQAASDYLARFSRLIRLVFENSMHKTIPLCNDLEALELYIQMEKLRFGKKINYHLHLSPQVDTEKVLIPPLLIQPFVENALLHGILPSEKEGNLSISITVNDQVLVIIIHDDGIGRKQASLNKEKYRSTHTSYGIKVTRERIDLLNTNSAFSGSVNYTDHVDANYNATGTSVEIRLPYDVD